MKKKGVVLGSNIKVELDKLEDKFSNLDTSGVSVSEECGTVVGIGEGVTLPLKVGDKILFKSYGVDRINIDNKTYSYISQQTDAIKEII